MKLAKYISLIATIATLLVSCEPTTGTNSGKGESDLNKPTLTADSYSIVVNTPITFTVTLDGADVTEQAAIFDGIEFTRVDNPFTPTVDGDYEFYAVVGEQGLISDNIKVAVTPTPPALPEDSDKANTSFNHRILLVDHTGNTCTYCPNMMNALKEVAEEVVEGTEETENPVLKYHNKYYEAMAHSFTATDPAGSDAANAISSYFGISSYPTLTFNFLTDIKSTANAEVIKQNIDALWKESADAGIAASASFASTSVVVNAEVKAAVENEYRINAWLLEDGIYAPQTGANGNEWMNTHNNAIRQAAITEPMTGFDLGTIAVGETSSSVMKLNIKRGDWVRENMKIMLIVSAKDDKGKYKVENVAICPIGGSVTYDYKK